MIVGIVVTGIASFSSIAALIIRAIEKVQSGEGLATYRTFWLVEFNYVGVLILFGAILVARYREYREWRHLEEKYSDIRENTMKKRKPQRQTTSCDCDYCNQPARLCVFGGQDYPYRSDFGPIWVCPSCDAWVRCHEGTTNPLGRLANAELREMRSKAHAVFDPLWQGKMRRDGCAEGVARSAAYRWLSPLLSKQVHETYIAHLIMTSPSFGDISEG